MFKTVLATAAAALIATAIVAPAQAGNCLRCLPNGVEMNGVEMNGGTWNGSRWNGKRTNGRILNGGAPAASSFVLDSIELPARAR